MKKKFLSFVLSICLLIPCVFALSACSLTVKEHNCSFKNEWSASQTDHWHACEVEGCKEVANKTEHNWDSGVELSQPTPTTDGVTKYTCLVCDYEKTESISFAELKTVTQAQWQAAFAFDVEDLTMTGETDGEKDAVIKFDGDIVYVYQVHGGSVDEGYYTQEGSKYYYYAVYEDGKCIRQEIDEIQIMDILLIPTLLDSVLSPTFNEFTYDAQTGLYKAETISTNPNASNYEIEFENGKVISISTRVGESDQTMTFNYDEVTLTLPEVTA